MEDINQEIQIKISIGDCEKVGRILEEQGEEELSDLFFNKFLKN